MKYFVYILWSNSTQKFYCGQTNNLQNRLFRHNAGESTYTKHLPILAKKKVRNIFVFHLKI